MWPWPVLGPSAEKQVGEAVHGRALVRRHARRGPGLGERAAVAAADHVGDRRVGRVEAGGHDEHVDRALDAVGGDDARGRDPRDRVGDDLDVGRCHRGVVVVGEQDPLAEDIERRLQPLAQGVVLHAEGEVHPAEPLDRGVQPLLPRDAGNQRLVEPVHPGPAVPSASSGKRRNSRFSLSVKARSPLGSTQGALRW